jgi:hypothetical protein
MCARAVPACCRSLQSKPRVDQGTRHRLAAVADEMNASHDLRFWDVQPWSRWHDHVILMSYEAHSGDYPSSPAAATPATRPTMACASGVPHP